MWKHSYARFNGFLPLLCEKCGLARFPRLLNATPSQLANWQISGNGYGIHWPEIDEDLSTAGLLRSTPRQQ